MSIEAVKKALTGPINLSMDLSPDSRIFAEFENGKFVNLTDGPDQNKPKQLFIISPLRLTEKLEQWSSDMHRYQFDCEIMPVLGPNFSPKLFPKIIPDELKNQIVQIAESIGPQIYSREKSLLAWQITLTTTFEDQDYQLFIQFADLSEK